MHRPFSKVWRLKGVDPAVIDNLTRDGGMSRLSATLLATRGITDSASVVRYLDPRLADLHDPFLLPGMAVAAHRLAEAVRNGERLCIHGDYDVDGISATALLVSFFRNLGADCGYHIPLRLADGYGISGAGLREIASRGVRVVVSVDCGIGAVDEAHLCRELGMDLIVTDHHTPPETLPEALAVVNPLLAGSRFPCRYLAGVGVAFNLAVAVRGQLRETGFFAGQVEPNLREYLDLVALGTIADVVPLQDENRVLVRHGLTELGRGGRVGIEALKRVAGVTGEVGCGAVGFRLAPRLNAAGRLDDAAPGVELLLTNDPAVAGGLATELDAGNAARQQLEQEILRDALRMLAETPDLANRRSIVLASPEWHPGVVGIVASRMVDLYHRPTILIALQEGNGRGSGRSIPAFHLHDALTACADHLVRFGGHRQAAGITVDEATLAQFVERFEEVAAGMLEPADLVPVLQLDAELAAEEVTPALVSTLADFAPYGAGNPEPVFMLRGLDTLEQRTVGGRHLRLRLRSGQAIFNAIGFGMAERDYPSGPVDIAFTPAINEWNGRSSLQLRLRDVRPAEE